VGFLGGFTTFSAYCLETTKLFESGAASAAWAYWALSPVLGLAAAFAGATIGRMLA
jgi:CrcB protein